MNVEKYWLWFRIEPVAKISKHAGLKLQFSKLIKNA